MDLQHVVELAAASGMGAGAGSLILAGIGVKFLGPFVDTRLAERDAKAVTRDAEKARIREVVEDLVRRDDGIVRTHVESAVDKLREEFVKGHTELRDTLEKQGNGLARIEGILRGRGTIASPSDGSVIPPQYRLPPER